MWQRRFSIGWPTSFLLLALSFAIIWSDGPIGLAFLVAALGSAWLTLIGKSGESKSLEILVVSVWLLLFALSIVDYRYGETAFFISGSILGSVVLAVALRNIPVGFRWLIVCAGLTSAMFYSSTPSFGPDPLSNWLVSIGLTPEMAWSVTVFLRKTVHFTYFGLVGWTAYRGVRELDIRMIWWWPLGWALLNAALDETRQFFTPGRTGSAWDVMLDMAGAVVFIAVSHRNWRRSPKDLAPESTTAA